MIRINRQLLKYFISIALIAVIFIIVISNISMLYFFTNYIKQSRLQDDEKLIQYIERLYEDGKGVLDDRSLMSLLHYSYSEGIDIELRSNDNQVIWESKHYDSTMHEMIGDVSSNNSINYKDYLITYNNNQVGIISVGRPQSILVTSQDREFVYTINGVYIIAFIFSVLLAYFLSLRLSKKFLEPIYSIKENAKLIEREQYSKLYSVDISTFELFDLSESIKELAEKLEYQENIRKRMTTDIAHELRTPLATLQSHIEAFMDGVWKPTQDKFSSIHDEITRLTKLVRDLSELSKIESDEVKLNMKMVSLSDLFNNVINNFEPMCISKNIKINKFIQVDVKIIGDEDRLIQIFINLLSNAYKFTNDGGEIITKLKEHKDKVVVSIEDKGEGISPQDKIHVFERFYRGDLSRSRNTGGTGIGLTLTKALVEAHNGSISIESQKEKGTKISIFFPVVFNN